MKEELNSDDLAGVYKEFAKVIGIDNTEELFKLFRGQQVTFPNKFYSTDYVRNRVKILHKEGYTVKEIAKQVSFTNRWVREILKQDGDDTEAE